MKCRGKKSNGSNCRANAMGASGFCFVHNPKTRHQHQEAARKGGSNANKAQSLLLPAIKLAGGDTVLAVLEDTINRVRKINDDGSMDVATANSVGHLCGKLLEAYKVVDIEKRLTAIETRAST